MPRFRNVQSGAVVSVSDETAARLGSEWESTDEPATKEPEQKAPAKKVAAAEPVKKSGKPE